MREDKRRKRNKSIHGLAQTKTSKEKETHTWMYMQKRKGMRHRNEMTEAAQHTQTYTNIQNRVNTEEQRGR